MPRSIPPHLLVLIGLLIFVVWIMLLRVFRRSPPLQRFIAEILGDDSPENALIAFEVAKNRLAEHLKNEDLDAQIRQKIELALGQSQNCDEMTPHVEQRSV